MELLSFPDLSEAERLKLEEFFKAVEIVQLHPVIQAEAIALRKKYRRRIPDAIIAASSMVEGAILLTADADFEKISEVKVQKIKFN